LILWTNIKRVVRGLQGQRCDGQASNGYLLVDISDKRMENQTVAREAEIQSQTRSLDKIIGRLKPQGSEAVEMNEFDAKFFGSDGQNFAPGSPEEASRRKMLADAVRAMIRGNAPVEVPKAPAPVTEPKPITSYADKPMTASPRLLDTLGRQAMDRRSFRADAFPEVYEATRPPEPKRRWWRLW
jgi:hypothetical protein